MTAGPRWRLAEARHGSLPVLLLALTVVTGVIDAVSLLVLGRVFVANMTGNVVLMASASRESRSSPWSPRWWHWPPS